VNTIIWFLILYKAKGFFISCETILDFKKLLYFMEFVQLFYPATGMELEVKSVLNSIVKYMNTSSFTYLNLVFNQAITLAQCCCNDPRGPLWPGMMATNAQ
jgi:hypothetical protein